MELQITFRHLDPSDALSARAQERADRLDRLLHQPAHVHVVFLKDSPSGVQVHLRGAVHCEAHANGNDLYNALDLAFDKTEQQLRKDHDRRAGHDGPTP